MTFGWRYFGRRLLVAVFLVWVLSVITFALYFTIPDEPASFLVDVAHAKPSQVAKARHELGVDRPVYVQYAKYVSRLVRGDFGIAWSGISFTPSGQPEGVHVGDELARAGAVTGWLALGGVVLLLVFSVPMAALAATRVGSFLDRGLLTISLVGVSLHPIVLGIILQTFLGNRWHVTPPAGYCSLVHHEPNTYQSGGPPVIGSAAGTCGGFVDWSTHMILPWLTFALFFVALYMRIVRVRLLEVLETDYVRAARARGASEFRIVRRHALPNTFLPLITMIGMDIGTAVGVAVYVETVYQLPGLGRTTLQALGGEATLDLPTILGVVLFVGAAIILLNLLVDLVYAVVDPTIRTRGDRAVGRAPAGGIV